MQNRKRIRRTDEVEVVWPDPSPLAGWWKQVMFALPRDVPPAGRR